MIHERAAKFEDFASTAARVLAWPDGAMRDGGLAALASRASARMLLRLAEERSRHARAKYLHDPGIEIAARWAELGRYAEAIALAGDTADEKAFAAIAPWLDEAAVASAREALRRVRASTSAHTALAVRQARLGDVAGALDWVFAELDA